VSHGIGAADFEHLTVGMILDALSEFIPEDHQVRKATQADMDAL
jgi:hypothetical protein